MKKPLLASVDQNHDTNHLFRARPCGFVPPAGRLAASSFAPVAVQRDSYDDESDNERRPEWY
jgi:hypothetical protein